MEIIAEAERLVSKKKATHVLIDGIQNSIPDIVRGHLSLETDVLERLKVLNRRALVVLAEVLYCPKHHQFNDTLHLVNRQVRRINREASGQASPQPWKVLVSIKRDKSRKQKDKVIVFPDSYSREGYHISHSKAREYAAELAALLIIRQILWWCSRRFDTVDFCLWNPCWSLERRPSLSACSWSSVFRIFSRILIHSSVRATGR